MLDGERGQVRIGGPRRAGLFAKRQFAAQPFIFHGVGLRQRFVPAEALFGSHRERFLHEPPVGALGAQHAGADGIVHGLLERHTPFAHNLFEQALDVRIEGDGGSHTVIIASEIVLS